VSKGRGCLERIEVSAKDKMRNEGSLCGAHKDVHAYKVKR
jgi:hypothetical protein